MSFFFGKERKKSIKICWMVYVRIMARNPQNRSLYAFAIQTVSITMYFFLSFYFSFGFGFFFWLLWSLWSLPTHVFLFLSSIISHFFSFISISFSTSIFLRSLDRNSFLLPSRKKNLIFLLLSSTSVDFLRKYFRSV